MVKQILKIILFSAALIVPVEGYADNGMFASEDISEVVETVQVTVKGRSIRVQHAQGSTMEVYSVTGAKVKSVSIDSNDQTVNLNLGKGCYIVKVGNVARKISLL